MPGIQLATNIDPRVNLLLDSRSSGLSTAPPEFKPEGLIRYETDNKAFVYWDGEAFLPLTETYTRGTGVTIDNNEISIGQSVETTDDVEFKSLDLNKDYGSLPVTDPFMTFTDSQNGGVKAKIEVINEGTSGGEMKFYTKQDGGSLTERLNVSQTGLLRIKTDGVGLQISTEDGTTEKSYLFNSIGGDKDFVIDANTGSSASKGIAFRIGNVDKLRIGANGNVGIGTTSPSSLLDVNGALTVNGLSYISHPTAPTVGNPVTNFKIDGSYDGLGSSFQILMGRLVSSGGYGAAHATLKMVGGGLRGMQIGEEDGANAYLDVKAGRSISYRTPSSASYMGHNFYGYVFNFNGSSVSSDDRLKWEEEDITNGLEVINKLKPQIYWKGEKLDVEPSEEERTRESGYIAQEVKQIPELAHIVKQVYNEDNTPERYFLDYTQIHAYHTSAIQELDVIVKNQQNTINILKNALNQLLSDAGKPTI